MLKKELNKESKNTTTLMNKIIEMVKEAQQKSNKNHDYEE